MQMLAVISFVIFLPTSIFELVAIPKEFALNIPLDMTCNFYTVWKRFGCLGDDMRYVEMPIAIILTLCFLVFFFKKESSANRFQIIGALLFLPLALASVVRTIYFLQGHTTTSYLFWTLPMVLSVVAIWYGLKNYPRMNQAELLNEKLKGTEETRLELEIEERKRELNK